MATYEILAAQPTLAASEESNFILYNKRSILPIHGIKKLLKSVRKLFKKSKVSPAPFNGDSSFMEILPSDEECDNLENERLEAQMAAASQ